MQPGSEFMDTWGVLIMGLFGYAWTRLFGWSVNYRGILWRRPKGYASRSPLKTALLTRYPEDGLFFMVARLYAYVFEAVMMLVVAVALYAIVISALGLGR